MLKRISLVFMLLIALVGIVGVQAQKTAEPQSMAKYLPSDADIFFSIRTDGAFLDELSGLVNGVVQKLPDPIRTQASMLDLKTLLESQTGPIAETGVGDYVALSASNTAVVYDQDRSNDDQASFYFVVDLSDRAKFEKFFESKIPSGNMTKSDENGATVYSDPKNDKAGHVYVTDDVAYITNLSALPSGDMLDTVSKFSDTLSKLPESNYNFVVYADFAPLFKSMMSMMPPQSSAMFDTMGIDFTTLGPIAVGGTVLDEKSLVIDAYSPSIGGTAIPHTGPIDPTFANMIPSGFSFVVQGTDLKTSLNSGLDLVYKMQAQQGSKANMPSREQINSQLKAFLGIDLDNDIIGWMGGNYALIGDLDMSKVLDAVAGNKADDFTLDPHFAFIVQGDGSDKPSKVANAIGTLLVAQTKNQPNAPKVNLSAEAGSTNVIIEDIPLSKMPNITLSIEISGTKDGLLIGDKATVDAILSGDGNRLSGDASFVEAQKYILPNASSIAYAGGEGWGDIFTLGGLTTIMNQMSPSQSNADQTKMVVDVLRSTYDMIGSSSLSVSYNEDGSQNSRIVLTLK